MNNSPDKKKNSPGEDEDNEFLRRQQEKGGSDSGGGRRGGPHGPMMREKPKNMGKTLRRLFSYIGRSKYLVIGLLAVMLLSTLLNLAGPALQGIAINNIVDIAAGNAVFEMLLRTIATIAAVYVISSALTYFQGIAAAKLSQKTVYTMRGELFRKISYLPIKYTDTHRHGDIMSRMTNDVENVSNTISQSIASLFSGVITLIGSLAMMLYYSPLMTVVALISIPLTILTSTLMAKLMRKYFVKQQRLLGNLNSHVEEMVTGYKTVVAYGREGRSIEEFGGIADNLKHTAILANIFGGIMGPIMNFINNFGFLLVAVTGGWLAIEGAIAIGTIQAFLQYSKQLSRPINEIANQYASILTAIAGAERVFEIMDADTESGGNEASLDASKVRGDISFKNIMFSYKAGEPVLKNFNLEVKQGQTIAIVGRTGSGKTTIVNLLTRFYDIDSGEILLDGRSIDDYTRESLRSSIAIVLQDTVLFSDTIGANIRYGKLSASDTELKSAAHTANADVFIDRLPQGYETQLSESGGNLSQGQRQLLSIARAVLADPKILILDEATSSVDTRTEMQIQSAMLALMKNRTSLVIAHRLSTIRDADMIIVLDDGHIVEHGNHDELLHQKGVYYNLYQTQFAGIET
ncbi:MAG: ABC transporter ATP-binding protein [Eubacteriales bacterium]